MIADPFSTFKTMQKESWASVSPLEAVTTIPAANLVKFSCLAAGDEVLDVGCGTGVVAITAAKVGAKVSAVDLSPALLERAQMNSAVSNLIFHQGLMRFPVLSLGHYQQSIEKTLGPVIKLVKDLKNDSSLLTQFRKEVENLASQYFDDNCMHQHYLMSRARKIK